MTAHQAVAAFPISSKASQQQARVLTVGRFPYVVASASEAANLIAVDPDTGAVVQDLMLFGRVFHYDPDDTTTAQDGTTCLVTGDSKRYKLAAGTDVVAWAVLDILSEPPEDPTSGDAYLVGAAATGDWSGKDDDVAIYTARGLEFVNFGVGRLLYVVDEDGYYHRKNDGTWTAGLGALVLAANTVKASSLIGQPVRWIVEDQTTNDPPGSPSIGDTYIVGDSPTGDWSGHAAKVAMWEGAAWGIYAPRDGELAYDKDAKIDYRYDGDVPGWVSSAGACIGSGSSGWKASPSNTTGGTGNYTWDASGGPTTTTAYLKDTATALNIKAPSGARIKFLYEFVHNGNRNQPLAVQRDSESTFVDYTPTVNYTGNSLGTATLEVTTSDDDAHDYAAVFVQLSSNAVTQMLIKTRLSYEIYAG